MTQAFSPTEIFKRATASTLRAIAERDDLNVGFGPEPAGLSGGRCGPSGLRGDGHQYIPPSARMFSRSFSVVIDSWGLMLAGGCSVSWIASVTSE